MLKIISFIVLLSFSICVAGQKQTVNSELQKLVESELSFARTAAEKNTKEAFLEFLADDGVLFNPEAVNGKELWKTRKANSSLLSWQPVFADISSNGILGYTTGNWEFRPKGKTDTPTAFGQFFSIWRKQPDGNFKVILDLGISHPKPENIETEWKTSNNKNNASDNIKSPAANSINQFYDTASTKSLSAAYKMFADENVRFLRAGKFPILGKKNALDEVKNVKENINFGKQMTMQSAGNLAYSSTTYQLKKGDKIIEKGNTVQVWKFSDGKWRIVMDVFSPIPEKQ